MSYRIESDGVLKIVCDNMGPNGKIDWGKNGSVTFEDFSKAEMSNITGLPELNIGDLSLDANERMSKRLSRQMKEKEGFVEKQNDGTFSIDTLSLTNKQATKLAKKKEEFDLDHDINNFNIAVQKNNVKALEEYKSAYLKKGKDFKQFIATTLGNNYTPLHFACKAKAYKSCLFLIENGASLDVKAGKKDKTPFQLLGDVTVKRKLIRAWHKDQQSMNSNFVLLVQELNKVIASSESASASPKSEAPKSEASVSAHANASQTPSNANGLVVPNANSSSHNAVEARQKTEATQEATQAATVSNPNPPVLPRYQAGSSQQGTARPVEPSSFPGFARGFLNKK